MFPVRCVTYVPGLYQLVSNMQMEPTRQTISMIMALRRAAHLQR
jgi:hypothetical protein